jgi:hypothetical protein
MLASLLTSGAFVGLYLHSVFSQTPLCQVFLWHLGQGIEGHTGLMPRCSPRVQLRCLFWRSYSIIFASASPCSKMAICSLT